MKNAILKTIPKLPNAINNIAAKYNTQPDLIFGKEYKAYKSTLNSGDDSAHPVEKRLLHLVNTALLQVPYYRNLYTTAPVRSLAEFSERIGFTDKEVVMQNQSQLLTDHFNTDAYDAVTTGGTSGRPLQLFVPKNRFVTEWATIHNTWARAGYRFDLRAVLRNHKLPEGRTCQINPITKEVQFDNFRLNEDYMFKIYRSLKKFNIAFFHAYPSAAYHFATFCDNNKLDLSFIKAFLSSSENIYPHQLEFMRQRSHTRLFGFYGHSEKLIFGAFCEHTDHFHIEPTYGYFELVDEHGAPVNTPGAQGEMVGTTLNNYGMPLIRYRTGDYAEYLGDSCPQCGRKGTILKKITGRWKGDKIYNKDGTYATSTALNLHNDLYTVINGLQYYQKIKGRLEVHLIKGEGFQDGHEKRLRADLGHKLAPDTEIVIRYVDQLLYNNNGKFLLLKSEVV